MIANRSAPPGPVVPWLVYDDVAAAIEWLCRVFGFTERLRTPAGADGSIHHAQLAVGAGAVVLTSRPGYKQSPGMSPSLFIPVDDVDAHYERVRQSGAHILRPPRSCEFGERQYSVEDLGGYQWTFSQSVADVNPPDWGAQVGKL